MSTPKKASFIKEHVLPVLLIFLIPGFSAWFFRYAERSMDRSILAEVATTVQLSDRYSPEDREKILTFYRAVPVSRIMASSQPEAAETQAFFSSVKMPYASFRWMKRIAWLCLGTIAATFVIVGISVAFSLRSQSAQYYALRIGWPVLRTSAVIQVLGQGTLAVFLSFWVTAIFFDVYVMKLIILIGLLAAVAVIALVRAIFAKIDDRCAVNGALVEENEAPELWQRIRELAAKLGTPAPDSIIAGIAPTFFVTEHPVAVGDKVVEGRTLFLSLPMLKVLSMEEADAILGHELAHFSGNDTLWGKKISPLTGKFALYLGALCNGLAAIVAHFMLFFWKLYGLSLSKLSREREFRADGVGAELVSKEAMMRALVKVTCYCQYRGKTELSILEQRKVDENLNLAKQLEHGYPAFLSAFIDSGSAIEEEIPHPFDSHPTLDRRLSQLGFDPQAAVRSTDIQHPIERSWYDAIATAPTLEESMWTELQSDLQSYQEDDLPWRLVPTNDEEVALVKRHFPDEVFRNKKGAEASLSFTEIRMPDWDSAILFADIIVATVDDAWMKKRLKIRHRKSGTDAVVETKCYPAEFAAPRGDLLSLFCQYYGRHQAAEARSKEVPAT